MEINILKEKELLFELYPSLTSNRIIVNL